MKYLQYYKIISYLCVQSRVLFLFLLLLAGSSAHAAITIQSITTTESTCGNNGTVTVTATSNKPDPFLIYEIIAGPSTAPLQNNSTFYSLFPGTYTMRVYDIDFAFKDQQFVVDGTYRLPDMQPAAINPICPGSSDGMILGHPVTGTGKAPFTWEVTSPFTTAPQASDSIKNLTEGTYTIKMTDACLNYQTRTVVLVTGGSGLSHFYDGVPTVNKLSCDSAVYSMQIRLFKEKARMPLKLTLNTSAGVQVKYVYAVPMDTITYAPGYFEIRDTIVGAGIGYSSYIYGCLSDTCGNMICASRAMTSPFEFELDYSTIANCGNKLGAGLRMKNPPYYPYTWTSSNPSLSFTLTDVATNTVVDSDVCPYTYCALTIDPQVSGRTYQLHMTDGCGTVYDKTILWPVIAAPRVETSSGVGCMDSTAVGYFNIYNFTSSVKITLLSGPSSVKSTKPKYEFSDVITYPKTFTPNSFNGLSLKNLAEGTYAYRAWDTCGNEVFGNLVVFPSSIADFNYSYKVKNGCLGDNMLYIDPRSSMTIGTYVTNLTTGALIYYRRGYNEVDSIPSLQPGKYMLQIYYGYDPMGGGVYDGTATDGNQDCWHVQDTITIFPYSSNVFKSNTTVFCNGSSYVQLNVDSTRGVPPYQYEIVSGPQTFPWQSSNVFQLPSYGTYSIRIKDACNNSNLRQITVDSAKFPPVIKKGASCTGSRIVLKGVSSTFFSYEWKRPDGTIYVGDSLVIPALSPADTGTYIITKKVTINGCTDTFRSTYHVGLKDESRQIIPFCGTTHITVGSHVYTLPGIYTDTLTNTLGCDSIVHTSILILPQKSDTSHITICKGDLVTVGTNQYSLPGIYKDSVQNAGGCYDLIITDLKVNGIADTTRAIVCAGVGKASANKIYYQTGIYSDTLIASSGCDSIIVLDLKVLPYKKDSLVRTVCAGNVFVIGTKSYKTTGIFRDTLSTTGCDSIVILNLTVLSAKKDSLLQTICEGQSTTVAGHSYNQTGIYRTIIPTATCDSTVILNLTVLPYKRNTINRVICMNQTYAIGLHVYNQTGTYYDTLATLACDSIVTLHLTVKPLPNIYLGADTSLCVGQSLVLNAGNGFVSYTWNGTSPSATTKTFTANLTGSYWVRVADGNGCVASDTLNIIAIYPLPIVNVGQDTTICAAGAATLSATGGISYQWMPGGMQQQTIQVQPAHTTTYTVKVTDVHSCSTTASMNVAVRPLPTQSIFSNNSITHCFDEGPMIIGSNYGNTFLWTPSGQTSQQIQISQEGTYQVTVWDAFQCSVTGQVEVKNFCEAALYVPSAFSPNGDGTHDDLEIFGKNFTDFNITIFNRWGEIIFISTEREKRWDGMYRGEQMPIGSYPWIIHYKSIYDVTQKDQVMKGSITLVR
ncbi:gliding motility-associated C-terminal domain-containing protein [Cytophaga aurantiaca]|uniref:gliding motility-associated C-terminal domain-containing protein n=1 Tax=Cytophaga aurantiaca TaxID=29530 RepID=UPI000374504C|nr:T9SS C-terminal target domain-containing protein [Cytophaga aurantiaca]